MNYLNGTLPHTAPVVGNGVRNPNGCPSCPGVVNGNQTQQLVIWGFIALGIAWMVTKK